MGLIVLFVMEGGFEILQMLFQSISVQTKLSDLKNLSGKKSFPKGRSGLGPCHSLSLLISSWIFPVTQHCETNPTNEI